MRHLSNLKKKKFTILLLKINKIIKILNQNIKKVRGGATAPLLPSPPSHSPFRSTIHEVQQDNHLCYLGLLCPSPTVQNAPTLRNKPTAEPSLHSSHSDCQIRHPSPNSVLFLAATAAIQGREAPAPLSRTRISQPPFTEVHNIGLEREVEEALSREKLKKKKKKGQK
jgi:hypothetical protein